MKALFVVNERSGPRREYALAEIIRETSPFEHEIVSCGRKRDLDAVVDRAEAEAFDILFAVGGDGTVHEMAKRLIGRRPALGVLPTGSGNGFARHIGLPIDPRQSLRACRQGRIVLVDTALVNDHPFVGVMGLGFDALIAERFATSTVRGLETYVKEGLRAFADFRPEDYEIITDDDTMRRRAFVIAIANSGQYGNNARIAPLASLRDGLLDVVIVGETRLVDAPLLLARLFTGSFHRASRVTSLQTRRLTIRRAAPGFAHLDGEPTNLPAELHVRVVPKSLRVLVPDGATRL